MLFYCFPTPIVIPLTYSGHLLLVERLGNVILVRNVVVHIPAPSLHGGNVKLHQVTLAKWFWLLILSQETFSEQTSGSRVVQRTFVIDILKK